MNKRDYIWQTWENIPYKEQEEWIKEVAKDLEIDYETAYTTAQANNDDLYYSDAKAWLDKPIDGIIIADLGLWNGRRSAYKYIKNANECLPICYCNNGYGGVYRDGRDLCVEEHHHDGTNYYTVFEIRDGARNKKGFDEMIDKIYMNKPVERKELIKYLRPLGRDFKNICTY